MITTIALPLMQRPASTWRLQETLLHRKIVIEHIQKSLQDYLSHNTNNDTTLSTQLMVLKAVIRGEFIAPSVADNRERKPIRDDLTQKTKELEQIHQWTGGPHIWRQLKATRLQLAALDQDSAEYSALRL